MAQDYPLIKQSMVNDQFALEQRLAELKSQRQEEKQIEERLKVLEKPVQKQTKKV